MEKKNDRAASPHQFISIPSQSRPDCQQTTGLPLFAALTHYLAPIFETRPTPCRAIDQIQQEQEMHDQGRQRCEKANMAASTSEEQGLDLLLPHILAPILVGFTAPLHWNDITLARCCMRGVPR